ncbi:MAG: hypothetical protein JNL81_01800 [Hyphomonadaceae bacterium]|nr:hypothetical protein [Hyphomonadaceae bacterium]
MSRVLAGFSILLLTVSACASPRTDFGDGPFQVAEPRTVSELSGQCIYVMISRTTTALEDALMQSCYDYTSAFAARWPTPCPRAETYLVDEFLMWSRANPARAEDPAPDGLTAAMARLGC